MGWLRQTFALFLLGLATTLARPRQALMSASGFVIAAFALVALLTLPASMARLAAQTGLADIAVIVPQAGTNPAPDQITALGNLPGVARDAGQRALISAQLTLDIRLRRHDGSRADVRLRGLDEPAWALLGEHVERVRGRHVRTGVNELLAGTAVAGQFVGLEPGHQVMVQETPWEVTGHFAAGASLWESELWMDLGALQAAWRTPARVNEIWVKLEHPGAFEAFRAALQADASLRGLTAIPQPAYYRFQIGFIQRFAQVAAWAVALVLGLGAALVVANALHLAFLARVRDTAMLRTLGFRRHTLLGALMLEVLAIASVSALIALALGWLLLDGRTFATATATQAIQLNLGVTWQMAGAVFAYTLLLAACAALWPIWHSLRVPLLRALHDE